MRIWNKLSGFIPQLPPLRDVDEVEGYFPPGWYSDHQALEDVVIGKRPRLILDVGSYLGGSAARFARYARQVHADDDFAVVAIDTWLGSVEHFTTMITPLDERKYGGMFEKFRRNIAMAGVANYIISFPQTSANAAKILSFHNIEPDLIYLDASHEYRDVLDDLRSYWPLLRPGGVLLGDDYEDPWFGVIQAVDEFATQNSILLEIVKHTATGMPEKRENQAKFMMHKPF